MHIVGLECSSEREASLCINLVTTADRLGTPNLVETPASRLKVIIMCCEWDISRDVDVLLDVLVPGLFRGDVCARLERVKNQAISCTARGFKTQEDVRDGIDQVLCRYPNLNQRVMVQLIS